MPNKFSTKKNMLLSVDRLVFLIDGVFAITLTLLILDLKPPTESPSSLRPSLNAMLPRLAIYLFAFATIVNHWVIHNRTFRYVKRGDNGLVLLSFVNLLFITLIPVSAGIVGSYPLQSLATGIFAINSFLLCLSAAAIWAYVAARRQLIAEDTDRKILRGNAVVWSLVGLGFAASLIVGQLSIYAEYLVWLIWPRLVPIWWTRRMREVDSNPLQGAE
jgi:uncharacterized membrane protein